MAEMKDSEIEWVGKIPENWKVLKNKYNFELSKEIIGTKWVETQLLSLTKYGIKAINDGEQTGKVPASLSTYQKVNKDDLVMCLFDLDCSAVFSGISDFDGMVSPAYKCIKCKAHLFPKYIDYYFRTVFVDRKYKRYSKNVRFSISADEFMNLPIIVPPKDMQINIANFLDKKCAEIDALHTDIEKQIETLEEYKKSVIREAVTRGLNPDVEMKDSGVEWIGNIPVHWKVKKIKYSATLTRGVFGHRPRNDPKYYDGDYPFIQTGDVASANKYIETFSQTLSELGKSVSKEFKKGTIAFTLAANVGDAAILDFDSYFPDSVMAIIPNKNINNVYLYYILSVMKTEFLKVAIVNTQMNLNVERVGNVYIPITFNDSEQREVVNYLDLKCTEIDGAITDKKQQLETLEQYKKSLIYEYVTGKKEVR